MSDVSEQDLDEDEHPTRLHLIWDVVIFQFKLAADGLRDIVLIPVSLIAALYGLVAGGHEPERYFKDVLRFGRRTEHWINLFGQRKGTGTSDRMIAPVQQKVFDEVQKNPWLAKAGSGISRSLDEVTESLAQKPARKLTKSEKPKDRG